MCARHVRHGSSDGRGVAEAEGDATRDARGLHAEARADVGGGSGVVRVERAPCGEMRVHVTAREIIPSVPSHKKSATSRETH